MSLFRRSSLTVNTTKDQPGHSILLNGSNSSPNATASSSRPIPVRQPSSSGLSSQDPNPGSSISTSTFGQSYASSSAASEWQDETDRESYTGSSTRNGSIGSLPSLPPSSVASGSAKVSFAPLPTVPPEMKRRNSITLGVAARKNLLLQQGTAPRSATGPGGSASGGARAGGSGNVRQVYMTDEEWEAYKKQYEDKHANDAVDLGELATKGAKNLWRKVRSGSLSSVTSSTSNASSGGNPETLAPPQETSGVSSSPRTFFKSRKRDASPGSTTTKLPINGGGPEELPTVVEENHDRLSPPRGLHVDLGAANDALHAHNQTAFSGSHMRGGEDADVASPNRGTAIIHRQSIDGAGHASRAGVRAAIMSEGAEAEAREVDGDATPRRLGSPPPPARAGGNVGHVGQTHSRLTSPPPKEIILSDEEDGDEGEGEEDETEEDVEEDSTGSGRNDAAVIDGRPGSSVSRMSMAGPRGDGTGIRRRASDLAFGRNTQPGPSILGFVGHQGGKSAQ